MRLPGYQDLSKEQDRVNNLPLDDSFLVTGPPGTGKTTVALYRAQMLRDKKRQVALLMYGNLLSQYTDTAVSELRIDGSVHTLNYWLWHFFEDHYRREAPQVVKYQFNWPEVLRIINEEPLPTGPRPDLLVDEGQDLPKEFYTIARVLSARLTVFADENQRVTDSNSTIEEIREYGLYDDDHCHLLTRNYRNTKEIAALAATFYTGLPTGIPKVPARSGDLPVVMRHDNLAANSDLEIGVLVPPLVLDRFVRELGNDTVNPVQHYKRKKYERASRLDFDVPGIKVLNYISAKGLEFDAVFLPALQEVGNDPDDLAIRMMMYVMASRARSWLFLSYWSVKPPPLVAQIPEGLVDRWGQS
jgi:superfamily I DNA/RNA helicase